MAIAASVILNRSSKILLDETGVLWSSAELLDYLNAAIVALISIKPDSSVSTASLTLTANTPKQDIPSDGLQLLDVTRNLTNSNRIIKQVERNHLDHADPNWPSTTTDSIIQCWMYDKRVPGVFYVYPTPTESIAIEISYVKIPTRLTASTDAISVDDVYEIPLTYFILAHAYAKNAKRGDTDKMNNYLRLFFASIGEKSNTQFLFSPNTPDESSGGKAKSNVTNLGGVTE